MRRAGPAILVTGVPPHKLFSTHVPSYADELKRNFAEKLTTLRLRLSSQAHCQTRVPPRRPVARGSLPGVAGAAALALVHCMVRVAVERMEPTELRAPTEPLP